MSSTSCQRTWQVEAARDGRLTGNDLSNALRHRSECADCAQAARALDELGRRLKALPVKVMDPLTQRRTRQALLGAWNTALLQEPRPRPKPRLLMVAALCTLCGVAFAVAYPLTRITSRNTALDKPRSALESASSATSSSNLAPPAESTASRTETEPPSPSAPTKTRVTRTKAMPAANAAIDAAEDDAYLRIIELLRTGHEREARTQAAQYLQRFPHGFRRPEVEKIAGH